MQQASRCDMTIVMTTPARERMVQSAAQLMRERGLAGTGMREIAEHATAPRGSLQHYFPDGKDQIVREALTWVTQQVSTPLLRVYETWTWSPTTRPSIRLLRMPVEKVRL